MNSDNYIFEEDEEKLLESKNYLSSFISEEILNFIEKGEALDEFIDFKFRKYLFQWMLVFDLLGHLQNEKKQYLIDYVRFSSKTVFPFFSEIVEQQLLSLSDHELKKIVSTCKIESLELSEYDLKPYFPDLEQSRSVTKKSKMYFSTLYESGIHPYIFFPRLSMKLYFNSLMILPSLARNWFNDLDRSASLPVSNITSTTFSPILIEKEV